MAFRRDDLSGEQLAVQRALDRSWAAVQRSLADPEFRAYLEGSLRRLDAKEPAPLTATSISPAPAAQRGSTRPGRRLARAWNRTASR
jgi:hypothetical protein